MYVAQAIQQIDTAGAEKSPFRTETNLFMHKGGTVYFIKPSPLFFRCTSLFNLCTVKL